MADQNQGGGQNGNVANPSGGGTQPQPLHAVEKGDISGVFKGSVARVELPPNLDIT